MWIPLQDDAAELLSAGLVDLDWTFAIQLAVFLVFAVLLNALLVRPLMRAQDRRHARMEGARADAEGMNLRAADAFGDYETRISDARTSAVSVREDLKTEARGDSTKLLNEVKAEVAKTLEAGRSGIQADADKARQELTPEIEALAALVVERILPTDGGAT